MPDGTPRIAILDEVTSNQIAAGEVIERPAAVVKELVENAIDAGATLITVEIDEGGKHRIQVTDNGCGMSQEDAILSLQRHATSKIREADDLFRITTMGFRGEALPSIASVSQFTLVSRTSDAPDTPGVEVTCHGGNMVSVEPVGAGPGTTITVENLFYNVPARLKFLKTSSTEMHHILELVQRFFISYPSISLRLISNGHETFRSAGSGNPLDACVEVFGRETARHLLPLSHERVGVQVSGFLGAPSAMKGSRAAQHTFVNHRFVRNRAITRALDEAYKSVQTIHGTKFPVAMLDITVDPGQIDVNVSPTKTEVRFTREGDVFSAVFHAVQEALMGGGLVPSITKNVVPAHAESEYPPLFQVPARPAATTRSDLRQPLSATLQERMEAERAAGFDTSPAVADPFPDAASYTALPHHVRSAPHDYQAAPSTRAPHDAASSANAGLLPAHPSPVGELPAATGADMRSERPENWRILGQTRNMYIVAQTDKSLLVIDQHIAHERVLYEQLLAGATTGSVTTQHLMIPITLDLERREALVVASRLDELRKAGFELEPFGGDSFLVRSVPASVATAKLKAQDSPEGTIRSIIEEMVDKTTSRKLLLPAEEVLITASCKMAVKAGDPLTFDEMHALVADLLASDNPYTCPHGRPIIVELPNGELDRKFGRG